MSSNRGVLDGFGTRITFSANTSVSLEETSVTPPGLEGGDPIDTTSNKNDTFRSKAPRQLVEIEAGPATVKYDPSQRAALFAMINTKQTITYTYLDTSTDAAVGWLRSFKPAAMTDGEDPTADIVIEFEGEATANTNGITYTGA